MSPAWVAAERVGSRPRGGDRRKTLNRIDRRHGPWVRNVLGGVPQTPVALIQPAATANSTTTASSPPSRSARRVRRSEGPRDHSGRAGPRSQHGENLWTSAPASFAAMPNQVGFKRRLRKFVQHIPAGIRERATGLAASVGCPMVYLQSSSIRKEAEARQLLSKHPVDAGLVCIRSCVEPCMTWQALRSPAASDARRTTCLQPSCSSATRLCAHSIACQKPGGSGPSGESGR